MSDFWVSSQNFHDHTSATFCLYKCILKEFSALRNRLVWFVFAAYLEVSVVLDVLEKCTKDSWRKRDHRAYRVHKYILVRI